MAAARCRYACQCTPSLYDKEKIKTPTGIALNVYLLVGYKSFKNSKNIFYYIVICLTDFNRKLQNHVIGHTSVHDYTASRSNYICPTPIQ